MQNQLPDLYFRQRLGGATVFRIGTQGSEQNLAMVPVAAIKLPSGKVRMRGQHVLSKTEEVQVADWIAARSESTDDHPVRQAIAAMNHAADWAEKAEPAEAARESDALLLAIHDLRGTIVRKIAATVETGAD